MFKLARPQQDSMIGIDSTTESVMKATMDHNEERSDETTMKKEVMVKHGIK